ncbi:MAG: hypothetical protein R3F22_01590 [Lysobacteraceae bacterium]
MWRPKWMMSVAGVTVFALGLASGLVAGGVTDSANRQEQARTDLSGAPGMEVIGSIIEIAPGQRSRLHIHHGVELYHVLQGAPIDVPGRGLVEFATGTTAFNLRDLPHGAFTVRGEQPLKLLTVHIVDKDQPLYDYADE